MLCDYGPLTILVLQENVLLDSDGHIRITDFGLAKGDMNDDVDQRTNSLIGTMEYMAPEIVAGAHVPIAISDHQSRYCIMLIWALASSVPCSNGAQHCPG